jgi:hypothetical protein
MTVYNPLGRQVKSWIRLPVVGQHYTITGPNGNTVQFQVIKRQIRNTTPSDNSKIKY